MKKIFLLLMFSILLITLVSAGCPDGNGYLGNKNYNECVRITQICASCTYVNISSITITTLNYTLAENIPMVNLGNGEWTYNFCNTSLFGSYFVVGSGDINGVKDNFKSCFDIGQNLSVADSIMYSMFVVILFLFFAVILYFIIVLPSENDRNDNNVVIGIIRLKYIRVLLIALLYPIILIILNLMNGLATNYANLTIFSGIIGFIFRTMISFSWVFALLIILWMFYMLVRDSNFQKSINKMGRMRLRG